MSPGMKNSSKYRRKKKGGIMVFVIWGVTILADFIGTAMLVGVVFLYYSGMK